MRKLGLLTVILTFFLASCSTTKVERTTSSEFAGDWTLTQIVTDQGQNVDITKLFDQSSKECFEGSQWHMVNNNDSGYYTLSGMGCPQGENKIKWYVQEDGSDMYFWFKRLDGSKAKDVSKGYKLKVVSVDETQAQLMQEVPFEGEKMNIHYYFVKQ